MCNKCAVCVDSRAYRACIKPLVDFCFVDNHMPESERCQLRMRKFSSAKILVNLSLFTTLTSLQGLCLASIYPSISRSTVAERLLPWNLLQ